MSKLARLAALSPVEKMTNALTQHIKNTGNAFASAKHAKAIISLESLDDEGLSDIEAQTTEVGQDIGSMLKENDLDELADDEIAMECASIIAMACGDRLGYHKAATAPAVPAMEGIRTFTAAQSGIGGSLDFLDRVSLESFDERELEKMAPYSIIFNVMASRQDEFSEAFYPTTVATPDQAGYIMSVRRVMVYQGAVHQMNGDIAKFDKQNLIEAFLDHTILDNDSTDLVPVIQEDGSSDENFVDPALVPPTTRTIQNVPIKTAPLKIGKKFDLLGVSQSPALISTGAYDQSDSIDTNIHVKALYMQIGDSVVSFNTKRLPRSQFNKSQEGNFREMNLNFINNDLRVSPTTLDIAGAAIPELAALTTNNWTMQIAIYVTGDLNVEKGNIVVMAQVPEVYSIQDVDGNPVDITTGAGKTFVDSLEFSLFGYDLDARRTNLNRRTRGLLLDSDEYRECYPIPLSAPMSINKPVVGDKERPELEDLVNAARIRTSNNALTTLLNYCEFLKNYVDSKAVNTETPMIEGIGRMVLPEPFYEEFDIDLETSLNSVQSADRMDDIAGVLLSSINEVVGRALRNSGYKAALDALSGGTNNKPNLVIGTDMRLPQYLVRSGDDRTVGPNVTCEIVSTPDLRMADTIIMSFVRRNHNGPDPLSAGTHIFIPELVSTVPVNRAGATVNETMVQLRNRHINNLPLFIKINVKNLDKVARERTVLDVNSTVVSLPPITPVDPVDPA